MDLNHCRLSSTNEIKAIGTSQISAASFVMSSNPSSGAVSRMLYPRNNARRISSSSIKDAFISGTHWHCAQKAPYPIKTVTFAWRRLIPVFSMAQPSHLSKRVKSHKFCTRPEPDGANASPIIRMRHPAKAHLGIAKGWRITDLINRRR